MAAAMMTPNSKRQPSRSEKDISPMRIRLELSDEVNPDWEFQVKCLLNLYERVIDIKTFRGKSLSDIEASIVKTSASLFNIGYCKVFEKSYYWVAEIIVPYDSGCFRCGNKNHDGKECKKPEEELRRRSNGIVRRCKMWFFSAHE